MGTICGVVLEHALIHGEGNMTVFLIGNGAYPSLINPEDLGPSGMKLHEELLSRIKGESRSSNEQKVIEEEIVDL